MGNVLVAEGIDVDGEDVDTLGFTIGVLVPTAEKSIDGDIYCGPVDGVAVPVACASTIDANPIANTSPATTVKEHNVNFFMNVINCN